MDTFQGIPYFKAAEGLVVEGAFRRVLGQFGDKIRVAVIATRERDVAVDAVHQLRSSVEAVKSLKRAWMRIRFLRSHALSEGRVLWEVSVKVFPEPPFGVRGQLRRQRRRLV